VSCPYPHQPPEQGRVRQEEQGAQREGQCLTRFTEGELEVLAKGAGFADVTVDEIAVTFHADDIDAHITRVSSLAGPLAARHGRAVLPPPGGDVIGRRRLDTHFSGLAALGIQVEGGRHYTLRRKQLRGADLLLDEASVTATENILMAATLANGRTTIYNAACEPHVQDLCHMLNRMGARICGIGTNYLRIEGAQLYRI
jgi:UDP-N-acetylglucosamine 1-carboxyvinyltransferase